jgi:hypothetical protein
MKLLWTRAIEPRLNVSLFFVHVWGILDER